MRKSLFLLSFSPIFITAQLQPKVQTYTVLGRSYDVTTPSNYSSSKQYPIIFELHSFNQDRNQMHNQDLVDELQYISVRPEGNMVSNYRAWNSWSVTSNLGLVNDVEYIKNVYNDVKTRLSIGFNPQKVYVYGFSNGGAMAMKMLEETDLFKAALIRSMSFEEGHTISSSAAKVPMIFVHGIADEVVPYQGGQGKYQVAPLTFESIKTTVSKWANYSGLTQPTEIKYHKGSSPTSDKDFYFREYSHSTHPIYFFAIDGGSHNTDQQFSNDNMRRAIIRLIKSPKCYGIYQVDCNYTDTVEDISQPILTRDEQIYRSLFNSILRGGKQIDVKELNIPKEDAEKFYTNISWNNPLLFHLKIDGNMGYAIQLDNPTFLNYYIPAYSTDLNYLDETFSSLEKAMEEYYSHLDINMSDEEIAYTMHQLITARTKYGQYNDGPIHHAYNSFSALGVFLNNKAVCQGYSLSFSLLMNSLGIKTHYVTGPLPSTSGHMWNRILIDNNWYNVDATFDDADNFLRKNEGSSNQHFLTSDQLFYETLKHPVPHNNLRDVVRIPSGNKFDTSNYVFRRYDLSKGLTKSEAKYIDGFWYYLSLEGTHTQIIRSNFDGSNKTILKTTGVSSKVANMDKIYYGKDKIYFIDYISGKYYVCSMDYNGNNFTQERQVSFIDITSSNFVLTTDTSKPITNNFSGIVALKAELALSKLRDLYYHGEEDYFSPKDPRRVELTNAIKEGERLIETTPANHNQANALFQKLRALRKSYTIPLSVKAN